MALLLDSAKAVAETLLPYYKKAEGALAIVGVCYAGTVTIKFLWEFTSGVRVHFWSRLWRKDLVGKYGQWAIVTGSTDGIGKGYARELARQGMNIILISRTKGKLEKVADEIKTQYKVKTEIVQADFSHGRAIYDDIAKQIEGKEIGILVNNVGMLATPPRLFGEITEDEIWGYANINVASVPAMTKLVLPKMLARKKGAIINVSSVGAHFTLPTMQIYTATKAFVSSFTKAIQYEYSTSNLTIQCIEPAAVSTNMTSFDESLHKPSLFVATADEFAANAVATLGYCKRTTGFWRHSLQFWMIEMFPDSFMYWLYSMNDQYRPGK